MISSSMSCAVWWNVFIVSIRSGTENDGEVFWLRKWLFIAPSVWRRWFVMYRFLLLVVLVTDGLRTSFGLVWDIVCVFSPRIDSENTLINDYIYIYRHLIFVPVHKCIDLRQPSDNIKQREKKNIERKKINGGFFLPFKPPSCHNPSAKERGERERENKRWRRIFYSLRLVLEKTTIHTHTAGEWCRNDWRSVFCQKHRVYPWYNHVYMHE